MLYRCSKGLTIAVEPTGTRIIVLRINFEYTLNSVGNPFLDSSNMHVMRDNGGKHAICM